MDDKQRESGDKIYCPGCAGSGAWKFDKSKNHEKGCPFRFPWISVIVCHNSDLSNKETLELGRVGSLFAGYSFLPGTMVKLEMNAKLQVTNLTVEVCVPSFHSRRVYSSLGKTEVCAPIHSEKMIPWGMDGEVIQSLFVKMLRDMWDHEFKEQLLYMGAFVENPRPDQRDPWENSS